MKRLSLRVRHCPGEPAHGVLMRLAARHGHHDIRRFARSIGLSLREVLAGHDVERIAFASGLDSGLLSSFSPLPDARTRTVQMCGNIIALGDWSTTRRRLCPTCIADDLVLAAAIGREPGTVTYQRAFWDVRSIGHCPLHRTPLLDACPSCGVPIGWDRGPVHLCRHGCDLVIHDDRGDADVAFDAYLAGRLGFGLATPQGVLDSLPYRRVVGFCERVGRVAAAGWLKRLSRQSSEQDEASRRAGFEMLAHWPMSFFDALDRIVSTQASQRGGGLIHRYGWIYPDWLAVEEDEVSAVIRPLVWEHAVRNSIISAQEPTLGHQPKPSLPLKTVVMSSEMGFDRCRRTLEKAGLIPSGSRQGVAFTIDPHRAAAVLERPARVGLTRQTAAALLGVGRSRIADFLDAGLLERQEGMITKDSVAALLALVFGTCSNSRAPTAARPLPSACKAAGVSIVAAYSEIASKTVRAWIAGKVTASGLAAIWVKPSDLTARIRTDRPLSLVQASEILSIHPQCVAQLVAAGEIRRANGRGLDRSSVERFATFHVATAEAARSLGRAPRALIHELASRGVRPAFGPPAFRQALMARRDLQ